MAVFALDIGGAFIKTAFLPERGKPARSLTPFELWKQPGKLVKVLRALKPKAKCRCVITMTGELCDCFKDRKEGAAHIINAATRAYGDVRVLNVTGEFLKPREAIRNYRQVASANWVAVPLVLARHADEFLLVDIGSTTTDLTPVRGGEIANNGFTDLERMKSGELIYSGFLRTSIPAVAHGVKVRGAWMPLAAEYFCQMGDVHLALGNIGPKQYNAPTPDGGPKTVAAAKRRIARCLLADEGELQSKELESIAEEIARTQEKQILSASRLFKLPVISIGKGAFMLEKAFSRGLLESHPLMQNPDMRRLDPSLALAYLAR
ncbi:MAG: hypothetical protein HZA04_05990 [Nitrospinae bacterium]|nr:hypothetical protein [Nitrospinota bacterium]